MKMIMILSVGELCSRLNNIGIYFYYVFILKQTIFLYSMNNIRRFPCSCKDGNPRLLKRSNVVQKHPSSSSNSLLKLLFV
jgi:hypothetical protein